MNTRALLRDLAARGIALRMDGQRLRVSAPRGVLTAELKEELARRRGDVIRHLSTVSGAANAAGAPLSAGQQRLWFLEQLDPGNPAYNVAWTVRLTGPLDRTALAAALRWLVYRHDALRTRIVETDGQVRQRADARPPPLRDVALPEDVAVLEQQLVAEAREPFDIASGPLLRTTLYSREGDDHLLLLVMHHLVTDATSNHLLFEELCAAYQAIAAGLEPDLPPPPCSYADFVTRQAGAATGHAAELSWWRARLDGAPPALELPTDRPRPPEQSFAGAWFRQSVSAACRDRLGELGRRHGATLYMVLLAGFKAVLHRLTGESDIVIGTPVEGRLTQDVERVVGLFVNTLLLRTDLGDAPPFRELLARVRATALDAQEHQQLPFEALVEALQPERSLSRAPLFQVMFNLIRLPQRQRRAGALRLELDRLVDLGVAPFDLALTVGEHEAGLDLIFEYSTDLFDRDTVARLAGCLLTLLEAVAKDDELPLSRVPLLDAVVQRDLLSATNPEAPAAPGLPVHAQVAAQAARTPAAEALNDGRQRLDYAALQARVEALAARLALRGVGRGGRVGICLPRSADYVVAALAVLRAGAAYVPLDPGYPSARLGWMAEDAALALLITDACSAPRTGVAEARLLRIDEHVPAPDDLDPPAPRLTADDLAYVQYTSGSTGRPRGVMVTHGNLASAAAAWHQAYALAPGESHLQMASAAFDVFTGDWVRALTTGGRLVFCPQEALAEPERLLTLLQQESVRVAEFVPVVARALADHLEATGGTLPGLRLLIVGSDTWHGADCQRLRRRCAPGTRLINSYGLAEATIDSTWFEAGLAPAEPGLVPIGRPLPHARCYVLDAHGGLLPPGIPGELCIGGAGVAAGYLNDAAQTAARFRQDPFSAVPGARLLRTGDRARQRADGTLELLGRNDFQVKLRGLRIEPGEVEAALLGQAGIDAAVVVLRDEQLVAYVVGKPVPDGELRAALRAKLPDYMVPAAFVRLAALPLTPNGKLDRRALPAPAPIDTRRATAGFRTPEEVAVAGMFAELLEIVPPGPDEDFFALGGHSLLATRLVSRLRDALDVELPLRAVFEAPTVAGIAAALRGPRRDAPARLRPARPGQRVPLSVPQQRLWFLDRLQPGSTAYHLPVIRRLHGRLEVEALQAAVDAVVARHDILRTRFIEDADGVWQQRDAALGVPVTVFDVAGMAAADPDTMIAGVLQQPFDLATGPLMRVALLRTGVDEQLLVLVLHHIVADGWSLSVLFRELSQACRAALAGSEPGWSPLPLQYADYAAWQRDWLQGEELARQLDYWRAQLAGAPPFLDLPADQPFPAVPGGRGRWQARQLTRSTLASLRRLAQHEHCTLFMVLAAAFAVVLGRYAATEDVVVGTPVAGRRRSELENLVGFFINTLVLRTDLSGNPTFAELLARVRQVTLDAYANQDVPFEKIVEVLNPPRSLQRPPLVQVLLTFHNQPRVDDDFAGLVSEPAGPADLAVKFALTLHVSEQHDGLLLALAGSKDLFSDAFVAAVADACALTLEAVAVDAAEPLAALIPGVTRPVPAALGSLPAPVAAGNSLVATPRSPPAGADAGPPTPLEATLQRIWGELLGRDSVGVHDDFFAIGGHSLLATRFIVRLRDQLQVELPLVRVFEQPTVRGLAGIISGLPSLAEAGQTAHADLTPVTASDVADCRFPLSFAQQRLWFLEQLEGPGPAYNVRLPVRLRGPLDVARLQGAVDAVVERHESLRTTIDGRGGEPVQVVHTRWRIPVELVPLAGAGAEVLQRKAGELAATTLDLQHGPLLRVFLLQAAADDHVLLLVAHHVIADAWSSGVLFRDLAAHYESAGSGQPPALPVLGVQYADYAVWQRDWLQGSGLAQQVGYWHRHLDGAPPLLDLPTDRPRPPLQTYRGDRFGRTLDADLSAGLRRLAGQEHTTLFMLLLAAWNALLFRWSGQADVVVGTPIAGRRRSELENLVGCFANTLAVRTQLDGGESFRALLQRVRAAALEAFAHQDLPFEKLVEVLQPPRNPAHSPLFQVMFVFQNAPWEAGAISGISIEPAEMAATSTARFDLTLSAGEYAGSLWLGFEFNTDLFDAATIGRMADGYVTLLEAVLANPDAVLARLPVQTAAERARVLREWNQTASPLPYVSVHELIAAQAARSPDDVAVEDGKSSLTYRDLMAGAASLAGQLAGAGVGPGSTVAICMQRSAALVPAVLGVLRAGAAFLPLDTAHPPARLRSILEDAGAAALVATAETAASLGYAGRVFDPETTAMPVEGRAAARDSESWPPAAPRAADDLAYLIYTSGSTGRPKGVRVPQRALCNFLQSMARQPGMAPGERLLAVTTAGFDIALLELLLPLTVGATTVIASADEARDPRRLMSLLDEARINVLQATPATWRSLLTAGWNGHPGLRMFCGGEALDASLAQSLLSRGTELWNLYGPTETTIWSTCARVTSAVAPVSVGYPLANTTCHVLDGGGEPVPPGVRGELWIGGAGVAEGYHRQPELTADRFRPDPFSDEPRARLYATGDRARRRADGALEILGRSDFQVKLRGFRIEPGEIEAVLLAQPGIREAAVLLRERPSGDALLVAYLAGEGLPGERELRRALGARLPDYMLPSACVALPALPRTASGKLDRAALPAPSWREAPAAARQFGSPVEAAVAATFSEILGRGPVGPDDDFFALGGHSLLATRLLSRLRDALDVELPLKALFLAPTPAGVAAALAAAGHAALLPAIVAGEVAPAQVLPLSPVQRRLWFLDRLQPGNPAYHLACAFRLRGRPDAAALQSAVNALVARHAALRTRFIERDGEPWQMIESNLALPVIHDDIGADGADAAMAAMLQAPFDLATGPLVRVALLRTRVDEQLLVMVLHHIVADGWSLSVLFRELSQAYRAALAGSEPGWAPLPLQYADYAAWQRDWLQGEELARQLDYWRAQLAGAPPFLDLPAARSRQPSASPAGGRVYQRVPARLLARLRQLAQAERCTLFMVLEATFSVVLGRYAGTEDVVVGTPVAGRRRSELENLVGFFINTLVLRTDLSGNPTFAELLARVRQVTLDAYANQDVPFEQLVEALRPPRSTTRTPVFQVLFNLHNEPRPVLELQGLQVEPFGIERRTTKCDLSVAIVESAGELAVTFEYNAEVFAAAMLAELAAVYVELLDRVATQPDVRLAALDATAADRCELPVVDVAALRHAAGQSLPAAIAGQVRRHGERLAVAVPGTRWSYAELWARAGGIAASLRAAGVTPGERIGIAGGQEAELVAAMLGVLLAGGVYVPLEVSGPAARVAARVRDADISRVLATPAGMGSKWLPGSGLQVLPVATSGSAAPPVAEGSAQDLAYVLYTSGSTGEPKGVMQHHGNVLHFALAWGGHLGLVADDRLSMVATAGYDAASQDIFGALMAGAAVLPLDVRQSSRDELLDWIASAGLTVWHGTPTVYRFLFGGHVACRQDLTQVRLLVLGGEQARRSDLELFRARFRRGARLVNGYGLTEATVALQWHADHDTAVTGDGLPLGQPAGDQQVLLLDGNGEPASVVGELVLASRYVTPGYWNRAALTRVALSPDADDATRRRFRSGDLARRLPGGELAWIGRRDEQVKVAGNRIEPGEIEQVLRGDPAVREAVVLLRPLASGDHGLVAYVVADADLRIAGLRARVREALPEAWWPAAFVCLPALPRLANGKLDRGALPLPAEEPAGAGQPVTAIEATLQSLWAELLRRDSVGVGDDFFALGGHSLLATRLIARLRDRLGVEVPLIRLFENPSIRDLAPVIANLLAQGAGPAAGEGVGPVIRRQSRQPGRAANP